MNENFKLILPGFQLHQIHQQQAAHRVLQKMKSYLTLLLYTYIFPQKHFRRIDSSLNEAHLLIIFVAPELLLEMMMMMVVVVVISHFFFPTKLLWLF
jgi:hypothetical protein